MVRPNSEVWVPMPRGFESNYEVSNLGRVRRIGGRVLRPMACGEKRQSGQTLKVRIATNPRRDVAVAELVLRAFVGPRPAGKLVMHLDDDKHNNAASNLQWGTPAENAQDMARKGRGALQVLLAVDVACIRDMRECGIRGVEIAALYGVSQQRICDVVKGRSALVGA